MDGTENKASRNRNHRHSSETQVNDDRQVQVVSLDTSSSTFAAECRRQSILVSDDPAEDALMDELEVLQDTSDWTP